LFFTAFISYPITICSGAPKRLWHIKTDGHWDWLFAMNALDMPEKGQPPAKLDQ
jgi:hypothetical protein